jgi:integrase
MWPGWWGCRGALAIWWVAYGQLRHTFAWTMGQHGATISAIQRKLGHKSIATTSLYLQALTSAENPDAAASEQAIGVESDRGR